MSEEINLSLDEYIRKKTSTGQLRNFDLRKKERVIDKEELDASLVKMARRNEIAEGKKKSRGKFDRFNDTDSDDEEEDDDDDDDDDDKPMKVSIDTDVEMGDVASENENIRFAQEIQQMDHPNCCKFKEFSTVESKMGIKVRPQQWRLDRENLDKPKGIPRLVALPLGDDEHQTKFKHGRVNKQYKQQNDQKQNVKAGIFVEKGNFTYKLDTNGDEESDSENLVGIVRNKPNKNGNRGYRQNPYNNYRNPNLPPPPPVNINMNWGSFFKGFANCVKATNGGPVPPNYIQPISSTRTPPQSRTNSPSYTPVRSSSPSYAPPEVARVQPLFAEPPKKNDDLQLKVAANDLLDYLLNKREKERREREHEAMMGIQQQLSAFEVSDQQRTYPVTTTEPDPNNNVDFVYPSI